MPYFISRILRKLPGRPWFSDELFASAAQAYREHRPTALLKFELLWNQADIASRQNTETAAGRTAVGRRDEFYEELEYALLAMLDAGVPLAFLQVLADDDAANLSDDQRGSLPARHRPTASILIFDIFLLL